MTGSHVEELDLIIKQNRTTTPHPDDFLASSAPAFHPLSLPVSSMHSLESHVSLLPSPGNVPLSVSSSSSMSVQSMTKEGEKRRQVEVQKVDEERKEKELNEQEVVEKCEKEFQAEWRKKKKAQSGSVEEEVKNEDVYDWKEEEGDQGRRS
jgi:hypothetical protein